MEEFRKDMLSSGEYIVELRDGKRYLFLEGYFVGQITGHHLSVYKCDLKHAYKRSLDVMKVYLADVDFSLEKILHRPAKLLWERKEIITISKDEALKKLAEVYGKEVKVEW